MKTTKTSQLLPFHTQVIGSLPRPKFVQELIAKRGEIPPKRFNRMLDDVVRFAIRLQERVGIDIITDGEWRRTHYIGEFLRRVGGFERRRKYQHQGEIKYTDIITHRMTATEPVFASDGRFLVENTDHCTKFALPSPFLIAVRYWHEDYSRGAYPTPQHFMDDLADILAREAIALVNGGIDVIQIDDPAMTYFCDSRLMEGQDTHDERLHRQWDIDSQLPQAIGAIHRIIEGLKAEVHLHCCHSVYKRQSDVVGDYKPILPYLYLAKVDRVNLEFAYPETGQVSDLALLPNHLDVGMGVVDVRSKKLQSIEQIESLGAAGAEIIGPQRIALNPDCGFAPGAGEPPSIDEAYEKLSLLVAASSRLRERYTRDVVSGA